jgi:Domain of unknown function (DUF4192)
MTRDTTSTNPDPRDRDERADRPPHTGGQVFESAGSASPGGRRPASPGAQTPSLRAETTSPYAQTAPVGGEKTSFGTEASAPPGTEASPSPGAESSAQLGPRTAPSSRPDDQAPVVPDDHGAGGPREQDASRHEPTPDRSRHARDIADREPDQHRNPPHPAPARLTTQPPPATTAPRDSSPPEDQLDAEVGNRTQVLLRGPGDLAEALPYLIGFHPDDSVVMIGLHGPRGRFGARLRVAIPSDTDDWPALATQAADRLINGAGPRRRPDAITVFVCQEPRVAESPTQAMARLRPLAQHLRTACGALDVPVIEALCLSGGRWWSYTCPKESCCPPEGAPLNRSGTSVIAAAAVYAGIQVRGSLREMEARLTPVGMPRAASQQRALNDACTELMPRLLVEGDTDAVRSETMDLAGAALERFRAAPPSAENSQGDAHDDDLLGDDEAAAIILGLQDRDARDMAAEWMEGADAAPAGRLWRALARRCVGAYLDHAAAPLTLAGWVAWSTGDEPSARVAFGRALSVDPQYTFANLLSQACTHGLDPEPLRRCLRLERRKRLARVVRVAKAPRASTHPKGRTDRTGSPKSAGTRPGGRTRVRRRSRTGDEAPE